MFNARFTCVKLPDITWDFDLAEQYINALKTKYKYKLDLEYNNCTILLNHNTDLVLIARLHHMLTAKMLDIAIAGEEYMG